jgi:phosphoribosylanthranilate isomerase
MKVKICGFKDPKTAHFAARQGADFIGVIRVPHSKRFISLSQTIEIAIAAREGGAECVAVYVNADVDEVVKECEAMKITRIQHYGRLLVLPKGYAQFYVNQTPQLLDKKDFLLFDHPEGGQGKPFCWETFIPPQGAPWFLAGGLHSGNVRAAIHRFHPHGVDVCTGVEKEGKKDEKLIEDFIREVKNEK